ncbi:MAG: GNAT family N-acetyltransferase [Candidatus Dormibacteraeota bacterium]|nr:GNAT family N-acetyltransferase [Candidatus Dormibacteraeota bacterium]
MRLAEPLCGAAFGLRSPQDGDAAFTVQLRSDPDVTRYLHRIPADVATQEHWEAEALARDDDLPLIVFRTTSGAPAGTAGIYRIDHARGTAEWGRWVITHGSLAAVESVLLILRLAFEELALQTLYARTLARNSGALSFHDGLGMERTSEGHMLVDGADEEYVEHVVTAVQAPALLRRLEPLAQRIARHLS